MRSVHSKKGFTLVEVIVVSVIVAILAAVAIPLYMGYLRDTRQQSVDQLAQSAAAAANDFYRRTGSDPADPVADLHLFYDAGKFTVSIGGGSVTATLTAMPEFTKDVAYR